MSNYQLLTATTNFSNDYKLQNDAKPVMLGEFDLRRLFVDSPIIQTLPENCEAILETVNYKDQYAYPAPAIFEDPGYHNKKKGPNYQVFLRILEAIIKTQNVCFATLPELHHSDIWRCSIRLPKEFKPAEDTETISPDETNVILENNTHTFEPTQEFTVKISVFEKIGIQIKDKSWELGKEIPFIAAETQDTYQDLSNQDYVHCICNEAYVTLTKTDPKAAKELYLEAVSYGHKYDSEDENLDSDTYYQRIEETPSFLTQRELAIAETQKVVRQKIKKIAKQLIESEIPQLFNKTYTLHLKNLAFAKEELYLSATVETPTECWKLEIHKGKSHIIHKNR
jgi:hypothetical protein